MWTDDDIARIKKTLAINRARELFRQCTDQELEDFKKELPADEIKPFEDFIIEIRAEHEMLVRLAEDVKREEYERKMRYRKKIASNKRHKIIGTLKTLIKQCDAQNND